MLLCSVCCLLLKTEITKITAQECITVMKNSSFFTNSFNCHDRKAKIGVKCMYLQIDLPTFTKYFTVVAIISALYNTYRSLLSSGSKKSYGISIDMIWDHTSILAEYSTGTCLLLNLLWSSDQSEGLKSK